MIGELMLEKHNNRAGANELSVHLTMHIYSS